MFKEIDRLKRALGQRLTDMTDLFKRADSDGDGVLDRDEFKQAVEAIGLKFDDDIVDSVFDGYESLTNHPFRTSVGHVAR